MDALTISVITGTTVGRMSQRRLVGIGSKRHEALEYFLIIEIILGTVVGLKECNLEDLESKVSTGGHCKLATEDSMLSRSVRMFVILDIEKFLKISTKTFAVVYSGRAGVFLRPSSLSTIWKIFC